MLSKARPGNDLLPKANTVEKIEVKKFCHGPGQNKGPKGRSEEGKVVD